MREQSVNTEASTAAGGKIQIVVDRLLDLTEASVTTSVGGGSSDAGDIRIASSDSVVLNRGVVKANASEGDGGKIFIDGPNIAVSGDSVIVASSEGGNEGEIRIQSPETALISSLASLPADFVDPSLLLASACGSRTKREGSFTVQGEAVPQPPDSQLTAALVALPAVAADSPVQCEAETESL